MLGWEQPGVPSTRTKERLEEPGGAAPALAGTIRDLIWGRRSVIYAAGTLLRKERVPCPWIPYLAVLAADPAPSLPRTPPGASPSLLTPAGGSTRARVPARVSQLRLGPRLPQLPHVPRDGGRRRDGPCRSWHPPSIPRTIPSTSGEDECPALPSTGGSPRQGTRRGGSVAVPTRGPCPGTGHGGRPRAARRGRFLPGLSREAGDRLHRVRAVAARGARDRAVRRRAARGAPAPGLAMANPNPSKSSGSA